MLKNLFLKLDELVCKYLGLNGKRVRPDAIEIVNGEMVISSTESYKRHTHKQGWEEFKVAELREISQSDREKLGVAMGKVIAKKLVVSFDEPQVMREDRDA